MLQEVATELYANQLLRQNEEVIETSYYYEQIILYPYIIAYGEDTLINFLKTDINKFIDFAEKDFPNIKEHLYQLTLCTVDDLRFIVTSKNYDKLMEMTFENYYKVLEMKNADGTIIWADVNKYCDNNSDLYAYLEKTAKIKLIDISDKDYAKMFYEKNINNIEISPEGIAVVGDWRTCINYEYNQINQIPVYSFNSDSNTTQVSSILHLSTLNVENDDIKLSSNELELCQIWIENYNDKIYYYIVKNNEFNKPMDIRNDIFICDNPNMIKIPLHDFTEKYGTNINIQECAEAYYNEINNLKS
jgi:hypothetical protein